MIRQLSTIRQRALLVVVTLVGCLWGAPLLAQTTTVTAAWDANADAVTAGYLVQYGTAPGDYTASYDAGTQTSAALTLSRGAVYYFTVRGYTSAGQLGPGSAEASIDLRVGVPVATLSATLASPTSALVSWQTSNAVSITINGVAVGPSGSLTVPISQTTTFTLVAVGPTGLTETRTATVTPGGQSALSAQISAGLAGDFLAQVVWSTEGAASVTINGQAVALSGAVTVPVTGVSNTFRLVATSASGAVVTREASTLLNPGPAVARISAVSMGDGLARVSWETSNAVSAAVNGLPVALSGTVMVPGTPGTRFTLSARNVAGAETVQETTVTAAALPLPPAAVVTAVDGARTTVSWTPPQSGPVPDSYVISVGTQPGAANLLDGFAVGNVLSVAGDLPPGRYYVQVRAVNAIGRSDAAVAAFRVGRTLPTPTGFTATWRGATVVLSWTPPAAAMPQDQPTSYVLEAGTASGLSDIAVLNLGAATRFEAPVPPGTYFVRVRALNGFGDSEATGDLVLSVPAP